LFEGGSLALAQLKDLPLADRLFLKRYPFSKFAPRPDDPIANAVTPLSKPLKDCQVALVTTAGLSLPGQLPFDVSIKNGDTSFREFSADTFVQALEMNQRSWSFDHTGILRDRNLAFPLDRLRELQQREEIGAIAPHHYSFMGSIVSPSKLMKETAPEVAHRLKADAVDVVLLTPV
jgi:D-proline reductase (dithiol) PrdB